MPDNASSPLGVVLELSYEGVLEWREKQQLRESVSELLASYEKALSSGNKDDLTQVLQDSFVVMLEREAAKVHLMRHRMGLLERRVDSYRRQVSLRSQRYAEQQELLLKDVFRLNEALVQKQIEVDSLQHHGARKEQQQQLQQQHLLQNGEPQSPLQDTPAFAAVGRQVPQSARPVPQDHLKEAVYSPLYALCKDHGLIERRQEAAPEGALVSPGKPGDPSGVSPRAVLALELQCKRADDSPDVCPECGRRDNQSLVTQAQAHEMANRAKQHAERAFRKKQQHSEFSMSEQINRLSRQVGQLQQALQKSSAQLAAVKLNDAMGRVRSPKPPATVDLIAPSLYKRKRANDNQGVPITTYFFYCRKEAVEQRLMFAHETLSWAAQPHSRAAGTGTPSPKRGGQKRKGWGVISKATLATSALNTLVSGRAAVGSPDAGGAGDEAKSGDTAALVSAARFEQLTSRYEATISDLRHQLAEAEARIRNAAGSGGIQQLQLSMLLKENACLMRERGLDNPPSDPPRLLQANHAPKLAVKVKRLLVDAEGLKAELTASRRQTAAVERKHAALLGQCQASQDLVGQLEGQVATLLAACHTPDDPHRHYPQRDRQAAHLAAPRRPPHSALPQPRLAEAPQQAAALPAPPSPRPVQSVTCSRPATPDDPTSQPAEPGGCLLASLPAALAAPPQEEQQAEPETQALVGGGALGEPEAPVPGGVTQQQQRVGGAGEGVRRGNRLEFDLPDGLQGAFTPRLSGGQQASGGEAGSGVGAAQPPRGRAKERVGGGARSGACAVDDHRGCMVAQPSSDGMHSRMVAVNRGNVWRMAAGGGAKVAHTARQTLSRRTATRTTATQTAAELDPLWHVGDIPGCAFPPPPGGHDPDYSIPEVQKGADEVTCVTLNLDTFVQSPANAAAIDRLLARLKGKGGGGGGGVSPRPKTADPAGGGGLDAPGVVLRTPSVTPVPPRPGSAPVGGGRPGSALGVPSHAHRVKKRASALYGGSPKIRTVRVVTPRVTGRQGAAGCDAGDLQHVDLGHPFVWRPGCDTPEPAGGPLNESLERLAASGA